VTPTTVICTFRVKKGRERAFEKLLRAHWPTLRRLGLVTAEPSRAYRGKDAAKKPYYVEIFTWKSPAAVDVAHRSPEVMAVWETLGNHVEKRLGRPAWEFPHVVPLKAGRARA
jgi:quinol monooxygenase YgiN